MTQINAKCSWEENFITSGLEVGFQMGIQLFDYSEVLTYKKTGFGTYILGSDW